MEVKVPRGYSFVTGSTKVTMKGRFIMVKHPLNESNGILFSTSKETDRHILGTYKAARKRLTKPDNYLTEALMQLPIKYFITFDLEEFEGTSSQKNKRLTELVSEYHSTLNLPILNGSTNLSFGGVVSDSECSSSNLRLYQNKPSLTLHHDESHDSSSDHSDSQE